MNKIERVRPLLDFIAKPESGGNYNIVWGGIRVPDRPETRVRKRLVDMTIRQVLAWQDSIDSKYMSEASGAYQIMEDTLRGLYSSAGLTLDHLFDVGNQDRLAYALLERRGLAQYLAGQITAEHFANNLAREWASLPVVTGPKKGRSYYAGDGLNQAHVKVEPFLDAVRKIKSSGQPAIARDPINAPAEHWLIAFLRRFLS